VCKGAGVKERRGEGATWRRGDACETQTWIELALRCKYIDADTAMRLDENYEQLIGKLVVMIRDSKNWTLRKTSAA
jgi:hypothetical protein